MSRFNSLPSHKILFLHAANLPVRKLDFWIELPFPMRNWVPGFNWPPCVKSFLGLVQLTSYVRNLAPIFRHSDMLTPTCSHPDTSQNICILNGNILNSQVVNISICQQPTDQKIKVWPFVGNSICSSQFTPKPALFLYTYAIIQGVLIIFYFTL